MPEERATRTVLEVDGMRDNRCRERIAAILVQVQGVKEVTVSLIRARAEVVYVTPCSLDELVSTLTGLGYRASVGHT